MRRWLAFCIERISNLAWCSSCLRKFDLLQRKYQASHAQGNSISLILRKSQFWRIICCTTFKTSCSKFFSDTPVTQTVGITPALAVCLLPLHLGDCCTAICVLWQVQKGCFICFPCASEDGWAERLPASMSSTWRQGVNLIGPQQRKVSMLWYFYCVVQYLQEIQRYLQVKVAQESGNLVMEGSKFRQFKILLWENA